MTTSCSTALVHGGGHALSIQSPGCKKPGLQTPELRARARQTDRAEPVPTRQLPSVAIEPGLQPRRGARNLPDSLQRKGLRHDHRVSARGAVGPSRTTKDSALESVEPGKSAGPREQASVVAASPAYPPVRVGAGRVRRSRPEHTPDPSFSRSWCKNSRTIQRSPPQCLHWPSTAFQCIGPDGTRRPRKP